MTRLIFTLSPGRCGTKYLAKMLQTISGNITVTHEAIPNFTNVASKAQKDQKIALDFWLNKKLPHIQKLKAETYIETSHLFINGFSLALLELKQQVDIIIIRRFHRNVALSFWRRNSIPGKTTRGITNLIDPSGPVLLPVKYKKLNKYQLCYWYCLEVEKRCEIYSQEFAKQGSKITSVTFNQLKTEKGFMRIVNQLRLQKPDMKKYRKRKDWIVNANPENYYKVFPDGNLDKLEDEVWQSLL